MLKRLVFILAMVMANTVFAGASSGNGKITELYINAKGTLVRLQFSEGIINPAGCQKSNYYIAELDQSNGDSRFLASLVAAYAAQSTIMFWINGCTTTRIGVVHNQSSMIFICDRLFIFNP